MMSASELLCRHAPKQSPPCATGWYDLAIITCLFSFAHGYPFTVAKQKGAKIEFCWAICHKMTQTHCFFFCVTPLGLPFCSSFHWIRKSCLFVTVQSETPAQTPC